MSTSDIDVTACPKCGSHYATALETGMMFCPECRNEWNPRDVPAASTFADEVKDVLRGKVDDDADEDVAGSYDTVVYVTHDDGGSGNVRTDRYTHHTTKPHNVGEAFLAATSHFTLDIGSEVLDTRLAERIPDDEPSTRADREAEQNQRYWPTDKAREILHGDDVDDVPAPDDVPSDEDRILAAAYLSTLTGTGLTLEGGQRATLLDFVDDDHLRAQLATGEVVVLDFNDVIRADDDVPAPQVATEEVDDETAELFGSAALTLACLVIEAGVASVDGDGDTQHLIEPPSGWFPPDEDAIPLMEQASAGAVAMLIQTFGLPRAELGAMVARVREGVSAVPDVGDEHDE